MEKLKKLVITLPGEAIPKKNSRVTDTTTGRTFPSARYNDWHDVAMFHAISQAKGQKVKKNCNIIFDFYHGDNRRRDWDNGVSSILDMLVDAGILPDDAWQRVPVAAVRNTLRKGAPSCQITIVYEE